MSGVAGRVAASASRLWLDHFAYSGRLLAAGRIPWLDPAALAAYYRKAHGLLEPGVVTVPLDPFFADWLGAHPELEAAMAAKRRPVSPLRVLLAAEEPRARLVEITRALRGGLAASPLVVALPSPRRWLVTAYARVHGACEPSGDDVEAAAMCAADFLRIFAGVEIDGVLLEGGEWPASREELAQCRPVVNLARHYRWDVGLKGTAAGFAPGPEDELDFCIAPAAGIPCGVILDEAFWEGAAAPALRSGDFYFAAIPADAVPERVLERLAAHRTSGS